MVVEGESEEEVVAFHPLHRQGFDLWHEACEVFGMGVEVERGLVLPCFSNHACERVGATEKDVVGNAASIRSRLLDQFLGQGDKRFFLLFVGEREETIDANHILGFWIYISLPTLCFCGSCSVRGNRRPAIPRPSR